MALSWKQPYAELMLHGKKETRKWATDYRGLVLICASKSGYSFNQVRNISGDKQIVRITKTLGRNFDNLLNNYNSGKAIAIGRLVDCRPMLLSDEDDCFVQYRPPWTEIVRTKSGKEKEAKRKLYVHIYEDVKPIEHFDWKGKQGWKEVPDEIKNKIKFL